MSAIDPKRKSGSSKDNRVFPGRGVIYFTHNRGTICQFSLAFEQRSGSMVIKSRTRGKPSCPLCRVEMFWPVLVINGAIYLAHGVISGRFRRKLLPVRPAHVIRDVRLAFTGNLAHDDLAVYNAVQRLLYAGVIGVGTLIVISGLAIWKPVQFGFLTTLFGDFDNARLIHFAAMSAIVMFLAIHIVMATLVPKSLRAMLRGR